MEIDQGDSEVQQREKEDTPKEVEAGQQAENRHLEDAPLEKPTEAEKVQKNQQERPPANGDTIPEEHDVGGGLDGMLEFNSDDFFEASLGFAGEQPTQPHSGVLELRTSFVL